MATTAPVLHRRERRQRVTALIVPGSSAASASNAFARTSRRTSLCSAAIATDAAAPVSVAAICTISTAS